MATQRWTRLRARDGRGGTALALAVIAVFALAVTVAITACGAAATADLAASASASTSPLPAAPLTVTAISPRPAAKDVSFAQTLTIRFSATLAADTPQPRLVPAVAGNWQVKGATLVFRPAGHWPPLTTIRVIVPAGRAGVCSSAGSLLAQPYLTSFTIGGVSMLRLQQLLASLDYLPLRFQPTSPVTVNSRQIPVGASLGATATASPESSPPLSASSASPDTASASTPCSRRASCASPTSSASPDTASASTPLSADLVSLTASRGVFAWRYPQLQALLGSLWRPGVETVLVRGAIMAFQAQHSLPANGVVDRELWTALLLAAARHQGDPQSYDYLQVLTAIPERLLVWQNGRVVYQSFANTGIAAAPTATGIFPVYARYLVTTMSGTNPDGSYYDDPGVPDVAYFNGGDAVHGFLRASYGYPQSLGCVELPYAAAAVVFHYDPIGTLVAID